MSSISIDELNDYIFTDLVYIICPTYNRRKFLKNLINIFSDQIYPSHLLYLIILDDSDNTNQDIIDNLDIDLKCRIIYIYDENKKTIGHKRNILNNLAKDFCAKYIVCFDDDDYYPPYKVAYGVYNLKNSNYLISGSSILPIYYIHLKKIYLYGPFLNKINYGHATNGTLIYDVEYLKNNSYDDNDTSGEEKKFLNNFKVHLLQLNYNYVILCIAHTTNTVDKNNLISSGKLTNYNLECFIENKSILNFYVKL
jgi:hypothetical protein